MQEGAEEIAKSTRRESLDYLPRAGWSCQSYKVDADQLLLKPIRLPTRAGQHRCMLRCWRFVAITDPQIRVQLSTTTIEPNRQRVVDASVIFVILGDFEAHRSLSEILERSVRAGTLTRETADLCVRQLISCTGRSRTWLARRRFGPYLLLRWCSCSQPAIMGLQVAQSDSIRIDYKKSCGPAIGIPH